MTWWFAILVLVVLGCLLAPDLRRRRRARTMAPGELGHHIEAGRRKTREVHSNRPDEGPTSGAHHRHS